MNWVIIIPARHNSKRFPGKALVDIGGMPMIGRVYTSCTKVHRQVWVATDHPDIYDYLKTIDGNVLMTSNHHQNGTSRCLEAAEQLLDQGLDIDVVLNIQGDEPFIHSDHIQSLITAFEDSDTQMASLMYKITEKDAQPHGVYVVTDQYNNALYFSRAKIPALRDTTAGNVNFYRHIGTYAYRISALRNYVQLTPTRLEQLEQLEQLRWLEHGNQIKMIETDKKSFSIDTPQDLERLKTMQFYKKMVANG